MLRGEVEHLQSMHGYPSVSILLPTGRDAAGNTQNPIRVKNLVSEAEKRLKERRDGLDHATLKAVAERLEDLAGQVDFRHALDGLALFASRDVGEIYYLPFAVDERVVVNDSFATRDLVYAMNRGPRYLVVCLAEDVSRLYEGVRDQLVEIEDGGFPMTRERARGDVSLLAGGGTQDSTYRDDADRQYLRHVDGALDRVLGLDYLPVAIAGSDRDLQLFREVTTHSEQILASVARRDGETPGRELARVVWPMVQEKFAGQTEEAMTRLGAAIGAHVAALGLADIWTAAIDGRVFLLLVEDTYHQPGRADESGRALTLTDEAGVPGVIDDAVDEVIARVAEQDGRVVFVRDGTLSPYGRIAAVLRY